MSLFSGMNITGGSEDKSKEGSMSEEGEKNHGKVTSVFEFIKDSSKNISATDDQGEVIKDSEERFPAESEKHLQKTISKNTPKQINVDIDLDLDLDFELDPLRPALNQCIGHRTRGTELVGIDFTQDVDLDALLEEYSISEGSETMSNNPPNLSGAEDIKERSDVSKHSDTGHLLTSEIVGNVEEEVNIGDEKGHRNLEENCRLMSRNDEDDIPIECPSVVAGGPSGITENPEGGESSLYDLELDVQDTLDVLLESHAASEHQLKLAEEGLHGELEHVGKKRLGMMFKLIKKQDKLSRLQSVQSQAIAEENYEQAEILTKECLSLEEDLRCIPPVVLDDAVKDIFNSRNILQERKKKERSEWIEAIQDLLDQQHLIINALKESRSVDADGRKLRLDTQKIELDRAMGHVLLDKNHVEKRESQLWSRIDEKTSDLRDTKDKLDIKKTKIKNEIAALEEQLCRLRTEEERLESEIREQEDAIDQVKAEFSEEISIIEEEKHNVKGREDRLNKDKMALAQEEEKHSAEIQAFTEALTREEALMTKITSSHHTITLLNQEEKVDKEWKTDVFIDLEPTADITSLREKVLYTTQEVQSTSALILSNQARLVTLKKKVSETEDHIVTLQEAKQFAVSMRKFGEAKRLTEEIKVKMFDGQSHQTDVESVSEELKLQNTTLTKQQEHVLQLKVQLVQAEKKWELDLCERCKQMVAEITTRLNEKEGMNSSLSARKLEIDKQTCTLLIGWLSGRHDIQMDPEVEATIEELKNQCGLDSNQDGEETYEVKDMPTAGLGGAGNETERELQELEEKLQKAVEDEDYDAASIQGKIESLQLKGTDAR